MASEAQAPLVEMEIASEAALLEGSASEALIQWETCLEGAAASLVVQGEPWRNSQGVSAVQAPAFVALGSLALVEP